MARSMMWMALRLEVKSTLENSGYKASKEDIDRITDEIEDDDRLWEYLLGSILNKASDIL